MAKFRRNLVKQRARMRCEYCQLAQEFTVLPHQIDHVRATKYHGPNTMENTCFACAHCNGAKGSNVAGFDPETGILVPLFNPRADVWNEHFRWQAGILIGHSPIARATIDVLRINDPDCVEQREELIQAGLFPPAVFDMDER